MADYLIQDTTLDAIADAINAKTGGSSAMTPAQMVTAIGSISGGGGTDMLPIMLQGSETFDFIDSNITSIIRSGLSWSKVRNVRLPNVTAVSGLGVSAFGRSDIQVLFAPNAGCQGSVCEYCSSLTVAVIRTFYSATNVFDHCSSLEKIDLSQNSNWGIQNQCFRDCASLNKLIIRDATEVFILSNNTAFNGTPFASGGTGGTIYIPKSLYDHLGDGTSLDYKAATNWSTIDSYGTITWAQIEGSIYETQYADGTPIPSE